MSRKSKGFPPIEQSCFFVDLSDSRLQNMIESCAHNQMNFSMTVINKIKQFSLPSREHGREDCLAHVSELKESALSIIQINCN